MSNIYILKQPLIHGLAIAVGFAVSPLSYIVHRTFIPLIPGPEKAKNKLKHTTVCPVPRAPPHGEWHQLSTHYIGSDRLSTYTRQKSPSSSGPVL